MSVTISANIALALFALSEAILRRGQTAKSVSPGIGDRGTSLQILFSYVVAVALLIVSDRIGGQILAIGWRWAGVVAAFAGIALRWWAMFTLGGFYTRTLTTVESQQVVDRGPYRYVRHPGYTGSLLTWLGASLALVPPLTGLLIAALLGAAYARRIRAEEAMLGQSLGPAYSRYAARTWRLLPLVY